VLQPAPDAHALPICRCCDLPGLHGTVDECLDALNAAVEAMPNKPRRVRLPDVMPAGCCVRRLRPNGSVVTLHLSATLAEAMAWLAEPLQRQQSRRFFIDMNWREHAVLSIARRRRPRVLPLPPSVLPSVA
jgi:hypothetical protein